MSSSDTLLLLIPASLRYGRENESLAINKYCCARTNTTVLKTGLIVNSKHPWLGCSPDGMIENETFTMLLSTINFEAFKKLIFIVNTKLSLLL